MNKKYLILLIILGISLIILLMFKFQGENNKINGKEKMELKSVFENNQQIPAKYTSDGENVNPPLKITGIPKQAKSLVLIIDDPDAPRGDWIHWVIWNIQLVSEIKENSVPKNAIQGLNDFNVHGYKGPSPPSGTHRYQFKLYALDISLDLSSDSKKQDVENAMKGHILDQAVLTGTYSRE